MYLYYLIGSLPALFFGSRFFIQWLISEKEKKSVVTPIFWRLSLTGNSLLALHYLLQFQVPFLLIQVINGAIAWRNLNLLKEHKLDFKRTVILFIATLCIALVLCLIARETYAAQLPWISSPRGLLQTDRSSVSFYWHLFGMMGGVLFASRFWVQWVIAERKGYSSLSKSFWILSLVGSSLSLIYFLKIGDSISILYALFGLIPYVRNLFLLRTPA